MATWTTNVKLKPLNGIFVPDPSNFNGDDDTGAAIDGSGILVEGTGISLINNSNTIARLTLAEGLRFDTNMAVTSSGISFTNGEVMTEKPVSSAMAFKQKLSSVVGVVNDGEIAANVDNLQSATSIILSANDSNGIAIGHLLNQFEGRSESHSGILVLEASSDPMRRLAYSIQSATKGDENHIINVTLEPDSAAGLLVPGELVIVSIAVAGRKGDQGLEGPQGPAGPAGEQGPAGAAGADGAKGDTGATGPAGEQGPAGAAGADGAKGDTGATGATGPAGEQGPAGGDGAKGDTGDQGLQGVAGAQGDQGPQGSQGVAGAQGDQGPQGSQGVSGGGLDAVRGESSLANVPAPQRIDGNVVQVNHSYGINRTAFLPSGVCTENGLPERCNSMVYLKTSLDMTSFGGTVGQRVYIPCYFNLPDISGNYPNLQISDTGLFLQSGTFSINNAGTVRLSLSDSPAIDVTITNSIVSGDSDIISNIHVPTTTLTSSNYDLGVPVTITASTDDDVAGTCTIRFTGTNTDNGYVDLFVRVLPGGIIIRRDIELSVSQNTTDIQNITSSLPDNPSSGDTVVVDETNPAR